MTYTMEQLNNAGYEYAGVRREEMMGIGYLQKMAHGLDVRVQDVVSFRLDDGKWALFLRPGYQNGFKSEPML